MCVLTQQGEPYCIILHFILKCHLSLNLLFLYINKDISTVKLHQKTGNEVFDAQNVLREEPQTSSLHMCPPQC